jgi:hypothetical protein
VSYTSLIQSVFADFGGLQLTLTATNKKGFRRKNFSPEASEMRLEQ